MTAREAVERQHPRHGLHTAMRKQSRPGFIDIECSCGTSLVILVDSDEVKDAFLNVPIKQ